MTFLLSDAAKLSTEPLERYFLWNLLRDARAMEFIPFRNVQSLSIIANRVKTLPSVAWRSINEGYTPNEGTTEQVWEAVYAMGGEIKFDRVFGLISNYVQDPKQLQTDMKIKAMAFEFNDALINGDHASNSKQIEGLKKRISNMPSRQSTYFAGSAAAALDPTASAANARGYLNKFNEMRYKTNRGQIAFYLMNEGSYYGFEQVMHYLQISGGNMLDVTQDSFDRDIMTYKGAPFIDIGFKKDQSTEIITSTETAGDAGSDATSIYAVSLDEVEGLSGIQLEPPKPYDPLTGGELEGTPQNLVRFEWWLGLTTFSNFAISRGRNVEDASNWT